MIGMKRIYYFQIMILSVFMLPLGGCFDSEINRSIYEADAEEMQRENHIVGRPYHGDVSAIPRYAEQDGRPRGAGFRKSTSRMYHAPGDGYVRSDSLLQHDE